MNGAFVFSMPPNLPSPVRIALGACLALAAGIAAPADPQPGAAEGMVLKREAELKPAREADGALPVFARGARITGETGKATVIEGDAEVRKQDTIVKGDTITYVQPDDELHAVGNVRVWRAGDLFTGPELKLRLDAREGYFLGADYLLANDRARGHGERIDFLGPDAYDAKNASYTTCGPGNDDWFMQVKSLKLDYGRDVGEVEGAKLYFLGRQIAEVPEMSFSLNNRRRSGVLTPTFSSSIQRGQEVSVPYYWNIAPNRDMTVTPRLMTKRGLQTTAEFRYLGTDFKGEVRGEVLPNDSMTKTTRTGLNILHQQWLMPGMLANLNINKVSDDTYFTDLSNRIAATSQTFLPREGSVSYGYGYYSLYARMLSYQTLQDPLNPVTSPYRRLPQLIASARRFDVGGFDVGVTTEYNRFTHPTLVNGDRVSVNPSVSYPMLGPGGYVIPKLAWHTTAYSLTNNAAGTPDRLTRNLPIMSLDSGLTFERETAYFGRDYMQTLEPRLYYLRVPARNQADIPVFDTGLADFNFARIFSDNIYAGGDRIADANQATLAVTSRLLDPQSGRERLRVTLGQVFYFNDQQVTLPGEVARTNRSSDFLAAFSGEVLPKVTYDGTLQYDPNAQLIQRVSHAVRYSPEPGRTLSVAYRYRRDFLEQVDFASQWRFGGGWHGVARYNYSIRDGRVVEALGGLEYDGDCWVGRIVLQRFATASQRASTGIFFQLELNGLSRLGSNPLELLRRNIPGYTKLNSNQEPVPRTLGNYE